jgi:hypothetical protein
VGQTSRPVRMDLRPTNRDENRPARGFIPAGGRSGHHTAFNRLRWFFDRARVFHDPLFPRETAPLAGLEETRPTVEKPTIRIGHRGAGTRPNATLGSAGELRSPGTGQESSPTWRTK